MCEEKNCPSGADDALNPIASGSYNGPNSSQQEYMSKRQTSVLDRFQTDSDTPKSWSTTPVVRLQASPDIWVPKHPAGRKYTGPEGKQTPPEFVQTVSMFPTFDQERPHISDTKGLGVCSDLVER